MVNNTFMPTPVLSLVIPTRERAEVLGPTLDALLSITRPDIEFIISDNASTDGTDKLVASYSDPRLKYSRSETRLSMPQNFERGLRLASGDFIMTLGDDDLAIEENINLALVVITSENCEVVYWDRGYFYWGNYPDPAVAGSFAIRRGRRHFPVDANTLLTLSYRGFLPYSYLPNIYNSIYRRSFLERYYDILRGCYFPDYVVSVDIFSSLVFCALSPSVRHIQSPATISGISHRSNGMSVSNGGEESSLVSQELGFADPSHIIPDDFVGKVRALTPFGASILGLLADYYNVCKKLLAYTQRTPPDLQFLAETYLRRLLADGHVWIDPHAEPYRRIVVASEVSSATDRDDPITFFFRLWSIPEPIQYAGQFSGNTATVRDLCQHLTSIEFNRSGN